MGLGELKACTGVLQAQACEFLKAMFDMLDTKRNLS